MRNSSKIMVKITLLCLVSILGIAVVAVFA